MQNRKGQKGTPTWLIVVLILVAAYLFRGQISNFLGGTSTSTTTGITDSSQCASTGLTTYTLNVQDELATTATNVNAEYYVFNGNGLISEGTTGTDGSVSFDVACGKDYQVVVINSTLKSSNGGYYGKIIPLQARIPAETKNVELIKIGGADIVRIENPLDTNRIANISIAAGQTKSFNFVFQANGTNAGFQNPIILCQTNVTSINTVSLSGADITTATVPSRLSASTGYVYRAWKYNKMLKTADGPVTLIGTITAQSSVTPATTDYMTCTVADEEYWKTSGYKTATSPQSAFLFGSENTESLADVAGDDAAVDYLYFVNANGV